MGQGFMITSCSLCKGDSYEQDKKDVVSIDKIDRNSKSYKKAIKDIMDINPNITRKEAIKMFDEAYIKDV